MENARGVTERRQARRYRAALPVELEAGTGLTRDVSAAGAFFETGLSFSVGETISFSLVLEHADPGGPLRLQCQGEVVRVEPSASQVGVAVRFMAYSFVPHRGSAARGFERWLFSLNSAKGAEVCE